MVYTLVFDDSDRFNEELPSATPIEVGDILDLPNTVFDEELSAYIVVDVTQNIVKVRSF